MAKTTFRSGFVAVAGRPNVGKSTLINALVGQKIAAVSPKPQTTRKRQLGILTTERGQMVFVDTPGIHKPAHKLGQALNEEARQALADADVILFVVDASRPPNTEDEMVARHIRALETPRPVVLALNKADLVPGDQRGAQEALYATLVPEASSRLWISALTGENLPALLNALFAHLPEGPPFYDPEQVTDLYERDIAADLIREAVLHHLRDEVPHSIAVRIDEYKERESGAAYIAATLFVERESQKGIVIGRKGAMLKQIGITARQAIEAMSGRRVYLDLRVKVRKNWRNDEAFLRQFGFAWPGKAGKTKRRGRKGARA